MRAAIKVVSAATRHAPKERLAEALRGKTIAACRCVLTVVTSKKVSLVTAIMPAPRAWNVHLQVVAGPVREPAFEIQIAAVNKNAPK